MGRAAYAYAALLALGLGPCTRTCGISVIGEYDTLLLLLDTLTLLCFIRCRGHPESTYITSQNLSSIVQVLTVIMFRFAIPFTFATTLGLAAVALEGVHDPAMRVLSAADVSAGLPAPSAAAALLGKSGAAAMLVLLFLAVTSATSAELIAVSSVLTYDVYKVRSSMQGTACDECTGDLMQY